MKALGIEPSRLLILATLPRSGTHLLKQLIANSISVKANEGKLLDLDQVTELMPNNWHTSYFNYHKFPFGEISNLNHTKPHTLVKKCNFDDITRSHSLYQKPLFKDSPIIHLRRNPLDYFVSLYNYKYKKRNRERDIIKGPYDVYLRYSDYYIKMYKSYKMAHKSCSQQIRTYNYEDLMGDTTSILSSVSIYLGLYLSIEECEKVASHCTIKKVIEQEKKGQIVNKTATNLIGSFTNSGKVGQWKKYLTDEQATHILDKLEKNGFDKSDFRYE